MQAMKAFIDADKAKLQSFLTSALYGYELSASCPGRFTPGESPIFPMITRGWMGPTVVKPVWTSRRREKSYALDGV
jgi:hypothetical protein